MKRYFVMLIFLALASCRTAPHDHVIVSETYPRGRCQDVGQVIGNASRREGARAQAIDDLKHHAALISANYVRLVAVTSHGTAARGVAYRCR